MSSRDRIRRGALALLLVLAATAISAVPAGAQAAARTGAFADPEPGGRGAALGGALSAVVDDPSAQHWNPARLVALERPAMLVSYADLFGLGLVQQAALFLAYPLAGREIDWEGGRLRARPGRTDAAYGLGLQSTVVDLDPESYTEYDISLGYARRGWLDLRYGGAAHLLLVDSELNGVGGNGFALDLALSRPLHAWLEGSLVLRSLFSSLRWEDETSESLCPRALIGLCGRAADALRIPLVAFYDLDRAELVQLSGGVEWEPVGPALTLRGGLRWRDDGADAELRAAVGAGLRWRDVGFDYGLASGREELGDTHRLSLQLRF
ncbi:MAG: hypothetical protein GF330_06670 [Candidatus Eisenbacteria bacterium]|nr:hypothetical protein [Candidatus Eisenbacteria bacterium]